MTHSVLRRFREVEQNDVSIVRTTTPLRLFTHVFDIPLVSIIRYFCARYLRMVFFKHNLLPIVFTHVVLIFVVLT